MTDERKDQLTAEADGLIEGRNAVIEALRTEASRDVSWSRQSGSSCRRRST